MITYSARMVTLSISYTGQKKFIQGLISQPTPSEKKLMLELQRDGYRAAAVTTICLPFELTFVIVAKLLVLHRLQLLATNDSQPRVRNLLGRLFLAAVISLGIVGFCGNIVSAFHYNEAALYINDASIQWASNNSGLGLKYEFQSYNSFETAAKTGSLQRFCEVAVLLMVIVAFCIVGIQSSAVISHALRALVAAKSNLEDKARSSSDGVSIRGLVSDASEKGKQLQRKVFWTVCFVFATVIVRSVLSLMFAFAQAFQNNANTCSFSPCNQCHNVYSHIHIWILYSPVLFSVVMLIASPLVLIVALWGMSDVSVLEQITITKAMLKSQWQKMSSMSQRGSQRVSHREST